MLFNMPRITFFLRSNNDSKGTSVLYCRVTYLGSKTEFSLKEKIKPEKWSQESQRFNGSKTQTRYIDTLLESVAYNIKSIALLNDFDTATEIVAALRQVKSKTPSLAIIVKKYCTAVVKDVAEGTLRAHNVKLDNLLAYEKHRKIEFTVNNFGLVEAERFKAWYKERAGTGNVQTASRNISFFIQALRHAQRKGNVKEFELMNYSNERDQKKPTQFLTSEELEVISQKTFHSIMLTRIRDLFLFQCYTGLSYGDLWSEWQIEHKANGVVITGSRNKNTQLFFIPMTQSGLELLEKYNQNMPRYSNPVYNRIIKEIMEICGISKRVTTHTARKTFATLKDTEGWTRESIAKMLGHKSIKTTERYYIGETNARIEQEMNSRIKLNTV